MQSLKQQTPCFSLGLDGCGIRSEMSLAMSLRLTSGAIDTNAWTCGTLIILLLFVVVVDGNVLV